MGHSYNQKNAHQKKAMKRTAHSTKRQEIRSEISKKKTDPTDIDVCIAKYGASYRPFYRYPIGKTNKNKIHSTKRNSDIDYKYYKLVNWN
jgi:hypothetical protein